MWYVAHREMTCLFPPKQNILFRVFPLLQDKIFSADTGFYFEAHTPSCCLLCFNPISDARAGAVDLHCNTSCLFPNSKRNSWTLTLCVWTRSIFRLEPVWGLNQQTEDITGEGQSARRPGGRERKRGERGREGVNTDEMDCCVQNQIIHCVV